MKEYAGSMYYSRQDRNYSLPNISLSMTCNEEPLSDVQFKAYKARLQEYKNFLDNVNRLANCVNVCLTEEPVSVGENGLLSGEGLNALQHAGSISVYNFFQQHNWEYPANPEGEMAVVRPHNPVADEFLDSEQPIRPDWPAVHLTKCFIDQDKAKLHGSALPLRSYLPPTISFRNAADVDDNVEPEVRTNKQMLSQEGDFEIVSTEEGIMVQKCVKEGKEAHLIPLFDFYYGRSDVKTMSTSCKAEYRFNCAACQTVHHSNVSLMSHMLSHFDEQTMKLFNLADVTICTTCSSEFNNAFELRNHMEGEHMSIMGPDGEQQVYIDTNNGNIICTIACRICEKNCESNFALAYHLQHHHREREMPYRCNFCNFCTSLYNDILCHFKKQHCDTNQLMCPYCLRTFTVTDAQPINPSDAPSGSAVAGQTHVFYTHLKSHKDNLFKHCTSCTLNFHTKTDFELHRKLDHKTQTMEIGDPDRFVPSTSVMATGGADNDVVNDIFDKHNAELTQNSTPQVKKMNAPEPSRVKDLSSIVLPSNIDSFPCLECGNSLGNDKHKRYLPCSMCRFASCCGDAFHRHVMRMHSPTSVEPTEEEHQQHTASLVNENQLMLDNVSENAALAAEKFFCSRCAVTGLDGNSLTNHLIDECGGFMATLQPDPHLLFVREQAERENAAMDVDEPRPGLCMVEHDEGLELQPQQEQLLQQHHVDDLQMSEQTGVMHHHQAGLVDQPDEEMEMEGVSADAEAQMQQVMQQQMGQQYATIDDESGTTHTITIPDGIRLKVGESLVLMICENNEEEFIIANTEDLTSDGMQEYFATKKANNVFVLRTQTE